MSLRFLCTLGIAIPVDFDRVQAMENINEPAVFPIPQMVCFPRQVVPLHIFEPRYRQMVADCLDKDRPLAIVLPKRKIADGPKAETTDEKSQQNQATYECHNVFTGGRVELLETTEDGRYLIEIRMTHRYQLKEWVQQVPYYIAEAEPLIDIFDKSEAADLMFDHLMQLSRLSLEDKFSLFKKGLKVDVIKTRNLSDLTFEVFRWCRLEAQRMQRALETTSAIERAEILSDSLEAHLHQLEKLPPERPVWDRQPAAVLPFPGPRENQL